MNNNDEDDDEIFPTNETNQQLSFSRKCFHILIRMPSIILIDLILLNGDIIYKDITNYLHKEVDFNYYISIFCVTILITGSILFCIVLFMLRLKCIINIYKFTFFVSLPYLFGRGGQFLSNETVTNELNSYLPIEDVYKKPVINIIYYTIFTAITISIYCDFYKNIFYDNNVIVKRFVRQNEQSMAEW
jgi:hypothetical protein